MAMTAGAFANGYLLVLRERTRRMHRRRMYKVKRAAVSSGYETGLTITIHSPLKIKPADGHEEHRIMDSYVCIQLRRKFLKTENSTVQRLIDIFEPDKLDELSE